MRGKDTKEKKASSETSKKIAPKQLSFSSVNNFRELDDTLRNSFAAIKKDMLQLKETQYQQNIQLKETRQAILDAKADVVTVDKFNVLKIKIGELNENMKKLWELDKKIVELDAKFISEADFDKKASAWENEFEKIRQDIKEAHSKAIKDEQMNKLINDINEEFDSIKTRLDELRSIKDIVTSGEMEKKISSIARELDDIRADLQTSRRAGQEKITVKQVDSLIADINDEFDEIKEELASLKSGKYGAKSLDLKKETARMESNLSDVRKELSQLKDQQKQFLKKEQADALVSDINNEFDEIKGKLKNVVTADELKRQTSRSAKQVEELKVSVDNHAKEISSMKTLLQKKYMNVAQAENLVNDVNSEFDELKAKIKSANADIAELKRSPLNSKEFDARFRKLSSVLDSQEKTLSSLTKDLDSMKSKFDKDFLKKKQAEFLVGDINKEFDELRAVTKKHTTDIEQLKKSSGNGVSANNFNKISNYFMKSIHSLESDYVSRERFNVLVDEVDKMKALIKKGAVSSKEAGKIVSTTKKLAALKAKNNVKLEKVKPSKDFIPYRKTYFAGNLLIVVAFILLIVSIIMFFLNNPSLTDRLAIISVGAFVVGLIIRIVVIVKRSKLVNGNGN